jgi:hypothetical protein
MYQGSNFFDILGPESNSQRNILLILFPNEKGALVRELIFLKYSLTTSQTGSDVCM